MGYPMTYQRVVHRNGLSEGDYGTKQVLINYQGISDDMGTTVNDGSDPKGLTIWTLCNELRVIDSRFSLLLGDLRRLERDATDEGTICKEIAQRTSIDPEVIAAVLKEFIAL